MLLDSPNTQESKFIVVGSRYGEPGSKFVDPTLINLGDRGELLKCPRGYWLDDENKCVGKS